MRIFIAVSYLCFFFLLFLFPLRGLFLFSYLLLFSYLFPFRGLLLIFVLLSIFVSLSISFCFSAFVFAIFSSAALSFTFCFIYLLWPGRGHASACRHVCCRAICSRAVRNRSFHLRLFIRFSFSFPYEVVKVHGGLSRSFPFHFLRFICGFLCRLFSSLYMLPIKPFPTYLTPFCGDDICCGE